jgi:hypothetical protein
MSAFLWAAGALITLAGLGLVAMGAIPHDAAFDSETLTSGTIAAVGGLLLIGIGVTVRELRRIQRVIADWPSRAGHLPEAPAADFAEANDQLRVPFPAKPNTGPAALVAAATLSPNDTTSEHLRAKIPQWDRSEAEPPLARGEDVSVSRLALPPEEPKGRRDSAAKRHTGNGAAPPRAITDIEARPRLSGSPATPRGRVLNAIWPGGQRREPQTAAGQAQAAVARALPAGGPAPASDTLSDAVAAAADRPAAVTILKSGVIEGMAYTLYSDGSIEAQLPQGTLRFGSIAALRDHMESKS